MAGDSERTYTYLRYMRDGTTEQRTGVSNDPKRRRNGKTARDRSKGRPS